MRCEVVQRRLMSIEDLTEVPADVRAHLAACTPCRDWQGQLVQLERHVPLLPVPKSRGKSRLLRKLEQQSVAKAATAVDAAAAEEHGGRPLYAPWPREPAPPRARKLRWVAALAAAIAVTMLGSWLLGP